MNVIEKFRKRDKKYDIWLALVVCGGIVAMVRYFFCLFGDYYTFVDEYQTFDTAVGFFKTGKLYQWDFHTQTLTDEAYSRAWPHTLLLALWFHIWGISVPAGKALSAIFGVLFILSVFYITYKIYHNYFITILSCAFLLGNSSVTIVFRQIRLYSLWLLVIIWFLYFVFLTLEREGKFSGQNRLSLFAKKNFNYPIKCVALAIVFLILSYMIHINTLITGAGILLFFFYLLITKRDKRYISFLCLLLGVGILLGILFWVCAQGIRIPILFDLYLVLTSDTFFGQYDEQNIRYWFWVRDYLGSAKLMALSCVCVAIAFVKNSRKKDRDQKFDFALFSILTVGTSLYCFIYVFSRYYQDRYMIYAAPLLSITIAWGIVETASLIPKKQFTVIVTGIFTFTAVYQIVSEAKVIYASDKICYHRAVYGKIQEDAEISPIPIAGYNFRDYYGVQAISDYVTAPFDRAHDMEILYEFAKEYPEGYVVVETAKIYGITESVRIFMQNHSERIAGDGIDEWNVDVCRYHFLYPETDPKGMYDGTGWESGCIKYSFEVRDEETEVRVAVDMSKMSPEAKILFLDFGIFTEEQESLPLCYQLVLPQNGENDVVEYSAVIDKPCIAVELKDDCEVYYEDETYREMKLWEK